MNNYFKIRKYGEYFEQLRELTQKYYDSEPAIRLDFEFGESSVGDEEQHRIIRNKIVRLLPYVNEAAEKLNISHSLISTMPGGPRIPVNLYEAIVDQNLGYRDIPKTKITDVLELSLSTCKKREKEALNHWLCPWNWIIDTCALIIRLPFLILRRAGLPPKIEENLFSRIIKIISTIVMVAFSIYKGLKVDIMELLKNF